MTSQTVQELSAALIDTDTHKQTDTTENNTTFATLPLRWS